VWYATLASVVLVWAGVGRLDAQQDPPPLEQAVPKVFAIRAMADKETGMMVFSTKGDSGVEPMVMPFLKSGMVGGMPGDDLGMLAIAQLQEDLELIDDQKAKLDSLRADLKEKRRTLYGDLKSVDPVKLGPMLKSSESLLLEDVNSRLTEILLPHQIERLKQLRLQMQMRNQGVGSLMGQELSNALGLSDEQKKKLAEKQKEAEKKLREKIEEIRRQLQQEILTDVLTPTQRGQLTRLIGRELPWNPASLSPPKVVKPSLAKP
jgi:hypothetical protein